MSDDRENERSANVLGVEPYTVESAITSIYRGGESQKTVAPNGNRS